MFEKEEKNSKRLSIDRIADLLRYKVVFDEESKKEIEKIVNDTWNLACSIQKMRMMRDRILEVEVIDLTHEESLPVGGNIKNYERK
jgi:hypothetical protein